MVDPCAPEHQFGEGIGTVIVWMMTLFAAASGVVGAVASGRLPASGKAAVALGLVPVAGVRLAVAFC
jgi:hypothetical protein